MDRIDRPREGGCIPWESSEKDRGSGKKVCKWRFNPNKLYNLIIFFFLIYECMQIKSGYRHIGKCSNWFYIDFNFVFSLIIVNVRILKNVSKSMSKR